MFIYSTIWRTLNSNNDHKKQESVICGVRIQWIRTSEGWKSGNLHKRLFTNNKIFEIKIILRYQRNVNLSYCYEDTRITSCKTIIGLIRNSPPIKIIISTAYQTLNQSEEVQNKLWKYPQLRILTQINNFSQKNTIWQWF